ncbi:hypothetical protein PInf_000683 [Phytophthora infestans]|nr:hypothetical protein PInf_000683 [Phytophthora infestans]
MEALLLQDGAYVNDRYEELQEGRRQKDQNGPAQSVGVFADCSSTFKLSDEERQQLEHWRIVQRAKALDTKGPTPQLTKRFLVLQNILDKLYAEKEADLYITSPSNNALKRPDTIETNVPIAFKELPLPTQIVLKMFFRTCQSLRDPLKLAVNSRLSVQIAAKLPSLLTSMPTCVLSPGLTDEVPVELEDEGNVWSVFYQLFQLFEELLGTKSDCMGEEKVCLSASDRATVVVAYVALSLKWGRLGYLLKGIKLLLENDAELGGVRLEPLQPLFRELAELLLSEHRQQLAKRSACGYLMSFGKGDHGKLGHGQCVHVSCQEGNCTENKLVPTMIAATRDILFRRIDSLSTHSIAITAKGDAMAWGNGDKYRLGHGSSTKEYTPRMIEHLRLKGRGDSGRLGHGDSQTRKRPTKIGLFGQGGLTPVALAVGDKYNLVLVRDNDAQYEVSHEAACALKMGFGMFYPTAASRCSLLWEILDDCKVDTPSMRTVIVSDQLCKDSTMTEIFKSLLPLGLLRQNVLPADMSATGKDIFDIKTLMIVLLKTNLLVLMKTLLPLARYYQAQITVGTFSYSCATQTFRANRCRSGLG